MIIDQPDKKKKNLENFQKIIIFILFALMIYSTFFFTKSIGDYFNKVEENKILQEEILNLEKKLQEKNLEISYKKTDDFLELEARKKYLIQKTNETVVAEPNIIETATETIWTNQHNKKKDTRKNWEKWRDLFFE